MQKQRRNMRLVAVFFFIGLVIGGICWGLKDDTIHATETTHVEFDKTTSSILKVKTNETDETIEELENKDYFPNDSLLSPQYVKNDSEKSPFSQDSIELDEYPVVVTNARIIVQTGSGSFDSNDNPGYDSSPSNDIVRTFDSVFYKFSFSVENTQKDTFYTDIRYRVTSSVPNAVTMVGNTPIDNGKFDNGVLVEDASNPNHYSSLGTVESTISGNGQVFIPVIFSVSSSRNGQVILPNFQIEILDAVNSQTGKTEPINSVYSKENLKELEVSKTTVSAKPSISARLVEGANYTGSVFNESDENIKAYDVGVITQLQPLQGRAGTDFKGSTFPESSITFDIKQRGTYQIDSNPAQSLATSQYDSFEMRAYAPATYNRDTTEWNKNGIVNLEQLTSQLPVPNAKTEKIYFSQPSSDLEKIGVYDSGKFNAMNTNYQTNITNSDFVGVYNPYTYTMRGSRVNANSKAFSSLELIYRWDKTKTHKLATTNNWSRYDMDLYIDSISYDGITSAAASKITYSTIVSTYGDYSSVPGIAVQAYPGQYLLNNGSRYSGINTSSPGLAVNYGNSKIGKGSKLAFVDYGSTTGQFAARSSYSYHMVMWDSSGFRYDKTREPGFDTFTLANYKLTYKFGIAKNEINTPPHTFKVGVFDEMEKLYDWFDTPEEAEIHGSISAVISKANYELNPASYNGRVQSGAYVPVTPIADGKKTPNGNPFAVLGAQKFTDSSGTILKQTIIDGYIPKNGNPVNGVGTFLPTEYDTNGNAVSIPMTYWNQIGESVFITPFGIRSGTQVEKKVYKTNEDVKVKSSGYTSGSTSVQYDSKLTVKVPIGFSYKADSSTDAKGVKIAEPQITLNSDGTSYLSWTFNKVNVSLGVEVNYNLVCDFKKISFNNNGYTNDLNVLTVADMWESSDNTIKDDSSSAARSSIDSFVETQEQQVIVNKNVDKELIEVGETAKSKNDTLVTYNIEIENSTISSLNSIKVLDVLPYDGDSRGTKFNGSYTIDSIATIGGKNTKILFSNDIVPENTDPNSIDYFKTSTNISELVNAKSLLITSDTLDKGEKISITITLKPLGQKSGDILVNQATFNSDINLKVLTEQVETKVYGRELSGVAWYDDNLNGILDVGEPLAKNIPIKLYRTSLVDTTYSQEIVTETLTGEKLIDGSGNSLIVTDSDGKYSIQNLPEGEYVVEFVVQDQLASHKLRITEEMVGTNEKINSKANVTTGKTNSYNEPLLSQLPTLVNDKGLYSVPNVNIGLIRPGRVRLFKYIAGTAIDKDGDGKLSNEEKATGTPLEGAEFELYDASTNTKLGKETTGANGLIGFDDLFAGKYYLIETKAPSGYELVKSKIPFEITTGNQLIELYQDNNKATNLPFTGGDKRVIVFIIFSVLILIVGIVIVLSKTPPPKTRRRRRG